MRDVYEPTTILTQVIKPPGYDQYPEAKAEIARQWARIQVGDPYDYSNWMSSEQREHARDYISSKGTEARILQEMQWHGKILPNLKRIDYDGAPLFIMEEDIHSRANPKYAERPGWFMRRFMGVLIWFSLNGAVIGLLVLVGRRMPHRVAAQRAKAPVDLFDHLVDDDRK
jgi:hypothetical protein